MIIIGSLNFNFSNLHNVVIVYADTATVINS